MGAGVARLTSYTRQTVNDTLVVTTHSGFDCDQRLIGSSQITLSKLYHCDQWNMVLEHLGIPHERLEMRGFGHDGHEATIEAGRGINATLHIAPLPAHELIAVGSILLETRGLLNVEFVLT